MIKIEDSNITMILPDTIAGTNEAKALGYAFKNQIKRIEKELKKIMVNTYIENLSAEVLDVKAIEMDLPYYDSELDIEIKRLLIKKAMLVHRQAGTKKAVEDIIRYVFGSGEVVEWFEDNSEAGTFKVNTTMQLTGDNVAAIRRILNKVKNASSKLEAVGTGYRLDCDMTMGAVCVGTSFLTIR